VLRQDEIVAVPIAALLALVITGELSGSRTAEHALLTANRVMLDSLARSESPEVIDSQHPVTAGARSRRSVTLAGPVTYVGVMSDDPSSNATVEWLREAHEAMNTLDRPPAHAQTDDFLAEDRRTHSGGVTFGQLDGPGFAEIYNMWWQIADGPPRFSIAKVVGVRGQRLAGIVERVELEASVVEYLVVVELDRDLRRHRRSIVLDLGDEAAATAELDRLHAEVNE